MYSWQYIAVAALALGGLILVFRYLAYASPGQSPTVGLGEGEAEAMEDLPR